MKTDNNSREMGKEKNSWYTVNRRHVTDQTHTERDQKVENRVWTKEDHADLQWSEETEPMPTTTTPAAEWRTNGGPEKVSLARSFLFSVVTMWKKKRERDR